MVPSLAFVGGLVVDSRRSKFHVADPTYIGPFKDKFSFWTGFLLLVRVIVLGLSTLYGDRDASIMPE